MESSKSREGGAGPIKRVAILFAGGPAPAANAVISTAAVSFLRQQDRGAGDPERLFRADSVRAGPTDAGGPRLRGAGSQPAEADAE